MGDKTLPGAIPLETTPDYEAMFIGAHPDDIEYVVGATSALWAMQGKKIVWVIMTDGREGSEIPSLNDEDLRIQREQEQRVAAEILGIQAVEFLRFPDGHLINNDETRRAVVRVIRKYRPRVVVTHDPSQHLFAPDPDEEPQATGYINHPDHRVAGSIVLDAIFPFAGNPRSYRELLAENLMPYRVNEIYLFMSGQSNTYIDVTETIDLKGRLLNAHASQFNPDEHEAMTNHAKERAAATAREAKEKKGLDIRYAESFCRMKLHVPPEAKSEAPEGEA
jgi:LmbE family N-acetylglucosaminyl deacetylase